MKFVGCVLFLLFPTLLMIFGYDAYRQITRPNCFPGGAGFKAFAITMFCVLTVLWIGLVYDYLRTTLPRRRLK